MAQIREMKVRGRDYEVTAFVDEDDYQTLRLGNRRWHRISGRTNTYIGATKNGKTILLHRLIMGLENAPRSVCVDHIDHDGLNNRRSNLRITNVSGNQQNAHKQLRRTSSLYKGVVWNWCHSHKNPWHAQIKLLSKNKHLGCFSTEIEAARAYNNAAKELFGTMACLNDLSLQDHHGANE